jgi:hypothetical protein
MDAFPSFKEFLASPSIMLLGLLSIKPDVSCTNCSQLAIFKSYAALNFRLFLSCFIELSLLCVRILRTPLINQEEVLFKDENNTPTNQQTKQELDQTRFTFVVTFVALGVWAMIN